MTGRTHRRSPLAVVVLTLLAEAPMHAYRMQQLIKERRKDTVVNVAQRNSIYQTIDRLRRADLIAVQETSREENRPERTVYKITATGIEILRQWMHEMLATPAREYPEFPAALASLPIIGPDEVLTALRARETALLGQIEELAGELATDEDVLPRLFLLETEYEHTVKQAELRWIRRIIGELSEGKLHWNNEWLREIGEHIGG
jgi:DNA-binding PadR family transcriptional regulator